MKLKHFSYDVTPVFDLTKNELTILIVALKALDVKKIVWARNPEDELDVIAHVQRDVDRLKENLIRRAAFDIGDREFCFRRESDIGLCLDALDHHPDKSRVVLTLRDELELVWALTCLKEDELMPGSLQLRGDDFPPNTQALEIARQMT